MRVGEPVITVGGAAREIRGASSGRGEGTGGGGRGLSPLPLGSLSEGTITFLQ